MALQVTLPGKQKLMVLPAEGGRITIALPGQDPIELPRKTAEALMNLLKIYLQENKHAIDV